MTKLNYEAFDGYRAGYQTDEKPPFVSFKEDDKEELFEKELRLYTLAKAKSILSMSGKGGRLPKNLPDMLSEVREVKKEDLIFAKPKNPITATK